MTERIKYGGCIAGVEEYEAVMRVLLSGNWACGSVTQEFEAKAAAWQGREHALFVNSGSSGLLLSLAALPSHSKIAMPALQFPTLYMAAKRLGHTPVLIDIDDSLNMDPVELSAAVLRGQVNAVAFVHMAGNPTHATEIRDICQAANFPLVEDICEALGSEENGVRAGNFGLVSAASTHGAHHISTGEGGLVFTDDPMAYAKMKRLRDWGRSLGTDAMEKYYYAGYVFNELGFNLHATDIQAALGIVQLDRLPGFISDRVTNHALLSAATERMPFFSQRVGPGARPSWYTFAGLMSGTSTGYRNDLIAHLEKLDIEARPIVAGNMDRQPISKYHGKDGVRFPNAERWFDRGFWVSVHPQLGLPEIKRIVEGLRTYWGGEF